MKTYILLFCSSLLLVACGGNSGTPPLAFATTNAAVSTVENLLATDYVATATGHTSITYTISGGADAAEFTLSSGGALSFDVAPDFEVPADSNSDNVYELIVQARDAAARTVTQTVTVAVANANEAPAITSPATATVNENLATAFFQVSASDPEGDAVSFSIDGGADANQFVIAADGQLSFLASPDYEAPADSDADNNYEVSVVANDGTSNSASVALTVAVSDVPFAISNLVVAPGADPRSAQFSWDVIEQPVAFDEYVLRSNLDGQSALTDHMGGITTNTALAEISLLRTDFVNAEFLVEARDASGAALAQTSVLSLDNQLLTEQLIGYFKSFNSESNDQFGASVAMSGDGNTIAVGALLEGSATANDPSDNSAPQSGAVYVFSRSGLAWTQQAYLKAPLVGSYDNFGKLVALDSAGDTLLISAARNPATPNGAIYVYGRSSSSWSFEANLMPTVALPAGGRFGSSLAISAAGDSVVIGAPGNRLVAPGAVYLFSRSSGSWNYDGSLLAASTEPDDHFGSSVAIDSFAQVIAVGAPREDSADRGINGNSADNTATDAGAVHVFVFDSLNSIWVEDAYIKAPNADLQDKFGESVALSVDGSVLVIGAPEEQSVLGNPADNSVNIAGAAYAFSNDGTAWQFDAILKSPFNIPGNRWGAVVDISGAGATVAVGSRGESSSGVGVQSDGSDTNSPLSGAVAVHQMIAGSWQFDRLLKAPNTDAGDLLGWSVALSDSGEALVTGARREDGDGSGIDSVDNNNQQDAGAAYVY